MKFLKRWIKKLNYKFNNKTYSNKELFDQKWKSFKAFDGLKFEKCYIRVLRKKDKSIFLRSDTIVDEYLQIRFDNEKQFNAIYDALKNLPETEKKNIYGLK